ncbi:MAG: transketolase [Rhodothermales bacterium]|nr:transketolase [Rhodothermales bacterium]
MDLTTQELAVQTTTLTQDAINTIRFLAVDAVQKADSGHPGLPMGAAPMAYVLWQEVLKHNPANPKWVDRDRFVLSAGHGSMLLYSLLHLTGYDLPLDELKQFRQLHSKTPGHPENFQTIGVETTTGPLGQGAATAVGLAVAERMLAARFNRPGHTVVDHFTYTLVSDGDLMEGVASEAASMAGHLGLGKLIFLYDDNDISIDGSTDISFTEDVGKRFEAYSWHVLHVADGNDTAAIAAALDAARAETGRPSIIIVRTVIGFGSPNKQGTSGIHGSPLGDEEVRLTKRNLGWPENETFRVPADVRAHFRQALENGKRSEDRWNKAFAAYRTAFPDLAAEFLAWQAGELPAGWEKHLPTFGVEEKSASRASSGKVINAIAPVIQNLVGGSADLTPSNNTGIKGAADFQKATPEGRYIRFGVREHGMAALCNGIALHGGLRPYCGTFLIFSDYLRPALRLSALMRQPVIYVFTHDSIGQGEDGPTHQPIEHYMALRAIPNLTFLRPADANEVAESWRIAMLATDRPTVLAFSRQNLPTLDRTKYASAEGVRKGAYVLSDSEGTPELILMATGSELHVALGAADRLRSEGRRVRVVSMPSFELFEQQSAEYRASVFPPSVKKRLSVEAGVTLGWERYVGSEGKAFGIDRFGESAPGGELFKYFGFTVDNIAAEARALLG